MVKGYIAGTRKEHNRLAREAGDEGEHSGGGDSEKDNNPSNDDHPPPILLAQNPIHHPQTPLLMNRTTTTAAHQRAHAINIWLLLLLLLQLLQRNTLPRYPNPTRLPKKTMTRVYMRMIEHGGDAEEDWGGVHTIVVTGISFLSFCCIFLSLNLHIHYACTIKFWLLSFIHQPSLVR